METVWLQTVYVLFFIELNTRQVHLAGCTTQPTSAWVTQQARQLVRELPASLQPPKHFLIHDRDTKFTKSFDAVFESEGIAIVLTPPQTPNANAFAERWVRSVREECLDQLLIFGPGPLHHILDEYIDYYNHARPHQGLQQQTPIPYTVSTPHDTLNRIQSFVKTVILAGSIATGLSVARSITTPEFRI